MGLRTFFLALIAIVLMSSANASSPESVSKEFRSLVPRQVMPLLHAPEIHQELKFSKTQVAELEALFSEIDSSWFQSRILPIEKQLPVLDSIDQRVQQWLADHTTKEQRARLLQIELQAQSVRMLLRADLADQLKLESTQQNRMAELARATVAAQAALQTALNQGVPSDDLQSKATAAAKAEQDAVKKVLKPDQQMKLAQLLGEPFELSKLNRIYPMAPEFVPVTSWVNSKPVTLKELRGKVVLVHFYAFQCHNCHANFEIYRRWHDQLRSKGVEVVGIQTPETAQERNPDAVKSAATERKLEFPILVDLESKNWAAWGNTMWPTVYVVDKNGYIRHWWQGELNWKGATADKTIENVVEQLLAERAGS
jgi:peroxiredoxin